MPGEQSSFIKHRGWLLEVSRSRLLGLGDGANLSASHSGSREPNWIFLSVLERDTSKFMKILVFIFF